MESGKWQLIFSLELVAPRPSHSPFGRRTSMLFRRINQHIRDQNWTAMGIDFLIVVASVFISIQFSNWNAAQGAHARHRLYWEH